MGWLAISRFAIRTRRREIPPLISRVLKQTTGKPVSPVQHSSWCGSIDKVSLPETGYIAAGAVSRFGRVKTLYPKHMNLHRF